MRYLLFFTLFFVCRLGAQTINVSRPVAGLASTSNTATFSMTAFTPTANSLLVLFVAATGTAAAAPTVSNSGVALTWTREIRFANSGHLYCIFWAKAGASPGSITVTFSCAGDNATGATLSIHEITGYDRNRENPIRQVKIVSNTASTTPSITFDNALDNRNGYIVGWAGLVNTTASTPPSGFTESDDIAYGSPNAKLSTARRNGGLTTAGPISFTNTASVASVAMGAEIYLLNKGIPLYLLRN